MPPETLDLFDIDPGEPDMIAALVARLQAHCTPAELGQFLSDLTAWERSIPREARPTIEAYTRMCQRGGFVPVIVRAYLEVIGPLRDSPQWREILQWREYVASLPAPAAERAA